MSVEEKFIAAVNVIQSLPSDGAFQPSEDLMLKLYAYYMQATEGPCNIPKPSVWYYSSRIKWNAWNELGQMDKKAAMEKYVEELTKVIETMSYSENVSKFMSLIGPFYEVVSSEEIDQLPDKKTRKPPTEYSYPVEKLEELPIVKMESPKRGIGDYTGVSSKNSKSAEQGSLNSNYVPQQCVIDMFKAKSRLKHQPFGSRQDILVLTIINLQNSLEEISQKLDRLQSLAKSADFNFRVEDKRSNEWNLGYSGTLLALLWPVAVHLCTRHF